MILNYMNHVPKIHDSCFIAKNSTVIGQVYIGKNTNIWYGVVLRGDENHISIGENTNIQDNTVVHITADLSVKIGDNVTIGHGAIIHGCTIGNNVLIGMGAIVLDGAVIEDNVIVGAGSVVPPGKRITSNTLVIGSPVKEVRQLSESDREAIISSARNYVILADNYKGES